MQSSRDDFYDDNQIQETEFNSEGAITRPAPSPSSAFPASSQASPAHRRNIFSFSQLRDRNFQNYSRVNASSSPAVLRHNNNNRQDDETDDEDNLATFNMKSLFERRQKRLLDDDDNKSSSSHRQIPVRRRTALQWAQRVAGYLGLAAITAAFHLAMWVTYWATVDLNNPAYSHYILTEPALNVHPRANDGWGTFVYWNRKDRKAIDYLITSMNEAVERYEEEARDDTNGDTHTWTKMCTFDNPADDMHACVVDTRGFGAYCYKTQLFGFDDGKPCFLIRVNKQVNWIPESFENLAELKQAGFPLPWTEKDFTKNYIPISCEGQTDVDKELLGPMKYNYPNQPYKGIATYYFPFIGQIHHASPGVMVNFYNVTYGVPIRIICKIWAKNVRHVREGPLNHMTGAVEFELMIDSGAFHSG